MSTLNVTRAKDRETMARAVEAIAADLGLECTRNDILTRERAIHLAIKGPRGLEVGVSFDGDDRQDRAGTFCLPFCIWDGDAKLSFAFETAANGSVNPFHNRKCTTFAHGFDDLCAKLRACFTLAKTGEAFQ